MNVVSIKSLQPWSVLRLRTAVPFVKLPPSPSSWFYQCGKQCRSLASSSTGPGEGALLQGAYIVFTAFSGRRYGPYSRVCVLESHLDLENARSLRLSSDLPSVSGGGVKRSGGRWCWCHSRCTQMCPETAAQSGIDRTPSLSSVDAGIRCESVWRLTCSKSLGLRQSSEWE